MDGGEKGRKHAMPLHNGRVPGTLLHRLGCYGKVPGRGDWLAKRLDVLETQELFVGGSQGPSGMG